MAKIGPECAKITGMKNSPPVRTAVIDIGSNAARLLVARASADGAGVGEGMGGMVEEMFARAPLKLGAEAFSAEGEISRLTMHRLGMTLLGFRAVILAQEPDAWGAFATAAMREAKNGGEVVQYLKKQAGVPVEILSGAREARIVGRHVAAQFPKAAVVSADIGGGSTDLVFAEGGRVLSAASFKIGTARADIQKRRSEFVRMEKWLADRQGKGLVVAVVGRAAAQAAKLCGGLSRGRLAAWRRNISKLPPAALSAKFGLEPDRAETAVSAALLYQFLLEYSGARELKVAQGGLPQALAAELARKRTKKK